MNPVPLPRLRPIGPRWAHPTRRDIRRIWGPDDSFAAGIALSLACFAWFGVLHIWLVVVVAVAAWNATADVVAALAQIGRSQ